MKMPELKLRKFIQEIILEGRADFEQATQDIEYTADFNNPLFHRPLLRRNEAQDQTAHCR